MAQEDYADIADNPLFSQPQQRSDLPPPAPPGRRYRRFQVEAILRARERESLLLADEMGLGKTIQAIGVINDDPSIRKVLIICPASLRINWKRELINWLARRRTTIGIATTKRWPLTDIVVVNYESLKPLHRNIHGTEWDLLVCDEAHLCKNSNSLRALEIFGRDNKDPMKRRPKLIVPRKLLLTGTPIVNRPFELWPLVHYLDPVTFPTKDGFIGSFCGGNPKKQKKSDIGDEALEQLHQQLSETIMVRRLKKDVLTELPEKLRQVVVLPDDKIRGAVGKERREYNHIQKTLSIARLKAEIAKTAEDDEVYRQAVHELHQAEFVTIQQITKLRAQTAMVKIPLVVEHVMNILEHVGKVVVFAHHTAVIENLALDFGEAVITVHGKHDTTDRQHRIDRFQTDPSVRVLIASMMATGVGLNMTAAQVACFAELDWAPSTVAQAEDRLHRIGQRGSVLIQHLVLDGSIDAMIAQKIVEKQETIRAALDDEQDRIDSLYALSRATPFVPEDRETILRIAEGLSYDDVFAIHDTLRALTTRGRRGAMSGLDFQIMAVLAQQESLEPNQAALGLVIVNKYHGK